MADFYQFSVENVFKATGSNRDGLSRAKYKKKLLEYGPNELPKETGFKALAFLWGQVQSPLVYILLIAAVLAFFAGEKLDTIIFVKNGMKVPADARLFRAKDLFANEALLTGESAPVKKEIEKIEGEKVVG